MMTLPSTVDLPDRDGSVYLMTDKITNAVRIALATGRPLLLRGDPGVGKSSLAPYFAQQHGWRFYKHVVTARTQAQDLLWTFDSVRRLGDARLEEHRDKAWREFKYIEPGALWWAFAPGSAALRGSQLTEGMPEEHRAIDRANAGRSASDRAVLLIDEIDKADPDLPNGLLVPLGSGEFRVAEISRTITKEDGRTEPTNSSARDEFTVPGMARHLVVITTNEERELPRAFLRRCVVAWLPVPNVERLVEIALEHHHAEHGTAGDEGLARSLAEVLDSARLKATRSDQRAPSTAEFLDAYRACVQLGIRNGTSAWEDLTKLALLKTSDNVG